MSLNLKWLWTLCVIVPVYFQPYCSGELSPKVQNALLADLQAIKYQVDSKYGPVDWKKTHLGWDLENEYEEARQTILSGQLTSVKDYQKLVKNFLFSTQDYHVGVTFYSTELAFAPFTIVRVKGHYYITEVNQQIKTQSANEIFRIEQVNLDHLNRNLKKIERGDEVIALDGVPIEQAIEQIIDENFAGNRTTTGYNLATRTLFFRRARVGVKVPTGNFKVTLCHQNEKKPFIVVLPWLHVPEWIENKKLRNILQINTHLTDANQSTLDHSLQWLQNKDFSVALAKDLLAGPSHLLTEIDGDDFESQIDCKKESEKKKPADMRMKGFLPPLGKILWETSKSNKIYAYLYQNQFNQRVGYIYLPSFSFEGQYEELMNELIEILHKFNKESHALVFDTTNNTGGNLFFMYAILSLLTDKPLDLPTQSEIIIQEDVYHSAVTYNQLSRISPEEIEGTLSGYPFTKREVELIKNYSLEIINSWKAGKRFTDPIYLVGIDRVQPHPSVNYTKPLIILMNELNLSCGDFFPAILKDNGRATLFGQRTGGAGGYVKSYSHASQFGVEHFSLTASIAYRTSGNPIENLGVVPDIQQEITKKDILNNYQDYIQALNIEVKKLK